MAKGKLQSNTDLIYTEVINEGKIHPSMVGKKSARRPTRLANDFPVGANVKCYSGGAVQGVTQNGVRYLDIKHYVEFPDIKVGREGKLVTRYFYDRYFFPPKDECNVVTSSHDERLVYRFTSFAGGDVSDMKDGHNLQDFIDSAEKYINEFRDSQYYIKTRLKLNEKNNKLYLVRGNFPHFSEVPNMQYGKNEEYAHEYVIYGGDKMRRLQKELKNKQ